MTAPTTESVATAPEVDLNDDALVAAAIGARLERSQHLFPDEPAAPDAASPTTETAAPEPDKAPDAAAVPADSTTPATDPEPAADPLAPDPFAELLKVAVPMPYKQNGTAKTFDGILEVPGKGAIIPPDKVDAVRNFIARGEANAEEVPRLIKARQEVEALGGISKFHEMAERNAQLNAASLLILEALTKNPRRFVNDDGSTNEEAVQFLLERASVASDRARFAAIADRTNQQQTFTQQTQESEVRQSAVPNYLASAHADLHPEDRAFLERKASQYLFAVTKEQASAYGQPEGTLMINVDDLTADIAHLKSLRGKATATESAATAAVKAAETAARENARRNPAPPKAAPKAPATPPRDRETGQWKRPERLDAAEIFDRSRRGESIGASNLTE